MDDGYMTERERDTVGRIERATEVARDALAEAVLGVKTTDGPAEVLGSAVAALLALDALMRDCETARAVHAALAAVE